MTARQPLAWLDAVRAYGREMADGSPVPASHPAAGPHRICLDGETHVVATDGRVVIAVRADAADAAASPPLDDTGPARRIAAVLDMEGWEYETATLPELRRWCGEPPDDDEWGFHGYDFVSDGGWIGDVLINRQLMALAIKHLTGDRVRLASAVRRLPAPFRSRKRWPLVHIRGDGGAWRIVIMGLCHGGAYPDHADDPRWLAQNAEATP